MFCQPRLHTFCPSFSFLGIRTIFLDLIFFASIKILQMVVWVFRATIVWFNKLIAGQLSLWSRLNRSRWMMAQFGLMIWCVYSCVVPVKLAALEVVYTVDTEDLATSTLLNDQCCPHYFYMSLISWNMLKKIVYNETFYLTNETKWFWCAVLHSFPAIIVYSDHKRSPRYIVWSHICCQIKFSCPHQPPFSTKWWPC